MNRPIMLRCFLLAATCLSATHIQQVANAASNNHSVATSERRVALVIGNAAYRQGPLANPVNDARAMASRLRVLGFDVTVRENLKTKEIGSVYREFRNKISPGAVALVFYAGHGLQVKGQNYFPAVDSDISGEEDVPLQSLNLGTLLDNMEEAKAGVSLIFLDACRDNPFARRFRSTSRGLAKVEAASGTLIHYATKPGSVADDGDGQNGAYTEALLAQIGEPGVPVEIMLKNVTNRVVTKTKGKQEPWIEGSLRGNFYFIFQGPTTVTVHPNKLDPEVKTWEAAESANTVASYQTYLDAYPNGLYAAAAKIKMADRKQSAVPPAPISAPVSRDQKNGGNFREESLARPAKIFKDCPECPEMVEIPAGSFDMGAPAGEAGRRDNEGPVRRVNVKRFAAGKFEVTRGQFAAFVTDSGHNAGKECFTLEDGKYEKRSDRNWQNPGYAQADDHPVACVNWRDAKAYVEWLSKKTGMNYRLPSEAEWEYMARAGSTTARYWGKNSDQACGYANVMDATGKSQVAEVKWEEHNCDDGHIFTAPAGSFKPNTFGLYDMIGNVWEWTEDCWRDSYTGTPTDGSAWSEGECSRVFRGGAWGSSPQKARSTRRGRYGAAYRDAFIGFRLARSFP